MAYRPDIDGLRAVAVISVIFYHAHLGFPGGFVGVDVFFVVSGFLITGLLVAAISEGRFSFPDFWERRVRRLLPALAAMTLFTLIVSKMVLLDAHLKDLGGALIAQPLLIVNIYYWRVVTGGYFRDPPEIRPLLHTWSLGVEEQFYILLPVFLSVFLVRTRPRRHISLAIGLMAVLSFLGCAWLTYTKPVFAFFTLPTRAWELLIGGFVAIGLPAGLPKFFREGLSWTGCAVIAYSIALSQATAFPGVVALMPCLGTAMVIAAGPLSTPNRVLAQPPLVKIGLMSYSLYLWHWPILAYGDYLGLLFETQSRWAAIVLGCVLGFLSWRFIETPFRTKQILGSRRGIIGLASGYAIICFAAGGLFLSQAVPPESWQTPERQADLRQFSWEPDPDDENVKMPVLGDETQSRTSFLLWGDSHGMAIAPVLDSLGKEMHLKGIQLTKTSAAPLVRWRYADPNKMVRDDLCDTWSRMALDAVREHKVKVVFLVGFWTTYDTTAIGLFETREAFAKAGAEVYFVSDVPIQLGDPVRQLELSLYGWESPTPTSASAHLERNRRVTEALNSFPPGHVIDPSRVVLSWQTLSKSGKPLYYDDDHLSDYGSLELRPVFEPHFQRMRFPGRPGKAS